MFTKDASRVFRSKTTIIFSSLCGMWSVMLFVLAWWITPKIGVGDRCFGGCRDQNPTHGCFRRGRFPGYRTGLNV